MSEWKKRTKKMEIPKMPKHKKLTCEVCGEEFYPKEEDRYTVAENKVSGGLGSALSGTTEGPNLYDCFDCPFCGCQIVAKKRLRQARLGEIVPNIVEKEKNQGGLAMQELEKIMEEIDEEIKERRKDPELSDVDICYGLNKAKDIIRKHMNDGWIPVEKELPPNAKHKGALCPRYQLMTKYGVTEGWYNPDYESWYVLCWFKGNDYPDYESWYVLCWSMGNDSLESEIDFERGTCHKLVRCENAVNDRQKIVLEWRPFPEPYRPERSMK